MFVLYVGYVCMYPPDKRSRHVVRLHGLDMHGPHQAVRQEESDKKARFYSGEKHTTTFEVCHTAMEM